MPESQTRSRNRKKGERKGLPGRQLVITAALMAVCAFLIYMVVQFKKSVDSVRISGEAFNYFGDIKRSFTGNIRLTYDDGTVTVVSDEGTQTLDHKPLYTAKNKLILPVSYAYVDIAGQRMYKAEHFATVEDTGSEIVLTDGNKTKSRPGGFLFDGGDTYVLLEDAEITCGENTFRLPAMSYIVAVCGRNMMYYNASTGESVNMDAADVDMLALFGNKDTVNMGTDTLQRANGFWYLLVADPEQLDGMP